MNEPVIAATCEGATLWVYDLGSEHARGILAEYGVSPEFGRSRPLQALLAHLDLEEWDWKPTAGK
jgi:hypothetical protein